MKKILILCTRFPYPSDGGDKLRVVSNINYLKKKKFFIELCYIGYEKININKIKIKNIDKIHQFNLEKKNIFFLIFNFFFSKLPLQINVYYKKKIEKELRLKFKNKKYSFIIFHLLRSACYHGAFDTENKYLDISDSLILNYKRFYRKSKIKIFSIFFLIEAIKIKKFYLKNYKYFKKIFYITNFDLKYDFRIMKLKTKNKFKLLNRNKLNTKKLDLYDSKSKNFLFIANFKSISNLVATWNNLVVEKELKKKNKKINTYFCGNTGLLFKLLLSLFNKKKFFLGNIEYLPKTKIRFKSGLANLVYSSGFQNKVLEYFNLNLQTITSREVSYGFAKDDRKILKIYKSTNEFKDLVHNVLKYKDVSKKSINSIKSNNVGNF